MVFYCTQCWLWCEHMTLKRTLWVFVGFLKNFLVFFFFLGGIWVQKTNAASVPESLTLLQQRTGQGHVCSSTKLCTSPHGKHLFYSWIQLTTGETCWFLILNCVCASVSFCSLHHLLMFSSPTSTQAPCSSGNAPWTITKMTAFWTFWMTTWRSGPVTWFEH